MTPERKHLCLRLSPRTEEEEEEEEEEDTACNLRMKSKASVAQED